MDATGTSLPGRNNAMDREGCSGIWQSIQFFSSPGTSAGFILQKLLCSFEWQFMQRWENNTVLPFSLACAPWQLLHVSVSLILKHLLALNNPYWLPCTSKLPAAAEASLTESIWKWSDRTLPAMNENGGCVFWILPPWHNAQRSRFCWRVSFAGLIINFPGVPFGFCVWNSICLAAGPWHFSQSTP